MDTEIKVQKRMFGCREDEVTGEWADLHNVELYRFSSSSAIFEVSYKIIIAEEQMHTEIN
jgi:hypothetical protein